MWRRSIHMTWKCIDGTLIIPFFCGRRRQLVLVYRFLLYQLAKCGDFAAEMNSCLLWTLFLSVVLICIVASIRMGLIEDKEVARVPYPPRLLWPHPQATVPHLVDRHDLSDGDVIRIVLIVKAVLDAFVSIVRSMYPVDPSVVVQPSNDRFGRYFDGIYMYRGVRYIPSVG
uniref:Peptidase_S26 domain-containing protein n=1 Tax=Steinernema glaseri TaxID=37863 RepID=A0A1I8A081_9BILA